MTPKKSNISYFKFKPFGEKQTKVLSWWTDNSPVNGKDGIVADGAIRSGKTMSMSLSYVMWAMEHFDVQNLGMCGKTIGSFRRNVLTPLKYMLKSRGYQVKDHRADNYVTISRNETVNYFYIFGGRDERSQDLVQGITLAGCFFDEVALMPESFVNQATGRCSVEGSTFWFNCNPDSPMHWFYEKWIKKHKELNLLYLHFTMDDNLSLSEKIKQRYRNMYAGVFFDRFIRGQWVVAEGLVYPMFNRDCHVVPTIPRPYEEFYISNDFGVQHPCVFHLWGLSNGVWYLVKEYYHKGSDGVQKDPNETLGDLVDFAKGYTIKQMYLDNAPIASAFNVLLRKKGLFSTRMADDDVLPGIQNVSTALKNELIKINDCCINTIREFGIFSWDSKSSTDEPLKIDDDAVSALRYFVRTKRIATPRRQSLL